MDQALPNFRYHPDPIATGVVVRSDKRCLCCGRTRGYIYTASVYSRDELHESLCPWCIADGSAAAKFGATFSDSHPLLEAGVADSVVEEVTCRTPGYASFQQEEWLACCGDACEFHGDAPRAELEAAGDESLDRVAPAGMLSAAQWRDLIKHYRPGGDPCVYKFVCRHCRRARYGVDFS